MIPNVSPGEAATPTWSNAVTDQLNELPPFIQHGVTAFVSPGAGGSVSVTFATAFGSTPTILCTPERGTVNHHSVVVYAASTTGFSIRWFGGGSGNAPDNQTYAVSINWVAIGTTA